MSGPDRKERDEEASRDGEPFDDSHLKRRGFKPTYFNYELPDSKLLYQQVRYNPDPAKARKNVDLPKKRFLSRRPIDNRFDRKLNIGQCVFGAGERRVIYNWPAIMRAGPGATVFVTEGEKNADDLIKEGLLATTVLSHKWTEECIAALAGCDLIILEDYDERGRKLAAKAQQLLAKAAKSTRVVPFPHLWKYLAPEHAAKNPPDQGDVSDWLYFKGDPKKLEEICREIPADGAINARPYEFPNEAFIPQWDWLYGTHLLRRTVSGTAAMSGTGKSSKAIVESLSMASGKPLLGVKLPPRPLKVLLINDNRNTMDKRIAAAMKHYHLSPEDIGGRLTVIAKGELKLKIAEQTRIGVIAPNETAIRGLMNYLIANNIDVVSIDPLRMTHRINENDNSAVGDLIECYDEIAEAANCAIHLWHHTRKSGGGEVTIESARGAQAFTDACRSVNVMETMTKDEAKKSKGVDEQQRKFYFRTFSGNLNFAPPVDQSDWFKLENVQLDNAGPDLFGDQVGVVTRWTHPGKQEPELTAELIYQIKDAVGREPRWKEHVLAEAWVGKAIAPLLGLDPEDDRVSLMNTIKKLIKLRHLKTALCRDAKRREEKMFVVAA